MAVRSGMVDIVSKFRQYTAESGTAIYNDDQIQEILDINKVFLASPLTYTPYLASGTTTYRNASVPFKYLEGTASGTALVRMTNQQGTVITAYQADFTNGEFVFDANTKGTAYYFTGYSFNFFKAVADGWFRKAGFYAGNFDFRVEGRQYQKSQVYKQCMNMKEYYESLADPVFSSIERGDMYGSIDFCTGSSLYERSRIKSYGEYRNHILPNIH